MSAGWWLLLAWAFSIPAWMMLYVAYKFRRCRGRHRFFLSEALLYMTIWAAWGLSFAGVPGAATISDILFAIGVATLVVGPVFSKRLWRQAQQIEAQDPREAEECRRAEDDLLRWKPWW